MVLYIESSAFAHYILPSGVHKKQSSSSIFQHTNVQNTDIAVNNTMSICHEKQVIIIIMFQLKENLLSWINQNKQVTSASHTL